MENGRYKIRPLFDKFQKELVAYANTQTGRNYISSFGGKELKEDYPVVKVTPDSVHQFIGLDKKGEAIYRAVFYSRSPYIGLFAEALTMADIAWNNKFKSNEENKHLVIPHFLGETRLLRSEFPMVYLASPLTVNPDANPESTTVDGYLAVDFSTETGTAWATIRGHGGEEVGESASTGGFTAINTAGGGNKWRRFTRSVFLFDTSSIIDSAIIDSAVFSLYVTGVTDTAFDQKVSIGSSNPTSNTALIAGDYLVSRFGSTRFATDVDLGSISTSAYNDWTFNASGLSAVSKTSVTKLGAMMSSDFNNSEPAWSGDKFPVVSGQFAEGANKPKLVITYTIPAGGSPMMFQGGGLAIG